MRAAIAANPQHGDAKYFLALQLMKSARGFSDAAQLLSSIALSSPQEPMTVFDFSPVPTLQIITDASSKMQLKIVRERCAREDGAVRY